MSAAAKQYDESKADTALITTEEVLTEFLNFYAEAGQHRRKIVGYMCEQDLLHPAITVISQSYVSFLDGLALYREREDKGYSLTDCISMIVCRQRDIQKVLTNDSHFYKKDSLLFFERLSPTRSSPQ